MGLLVNIRFWEAALQHLDHWLKACVGCSCIASDFCDCDGLSVQSCVRPVCVAVATGHDEFRKQGSYREYDL